MKAIVDIIQRLLERKFRGSLTLHFDGLGSVPKVEVSLTGKPDDVIRQL